MQHSQRTVQVLALEGLLEQGVVERVDVFYGRFELLPEFGGRRSEGRQFLEGAFGLGGGEELGLGSRLFTSTRELHSILNISRRRRKNSPEALQMRDWAQKAAKAGWQLLAAMGARSEGEFQLKEGVLWGTIRTIYFVEFGRIILS